MSRKTRKLIWSAPLVAVLAVVGALAMFVMLAPNGAQAHDATLPGAPMNVEAEAVNAESIRLMWDAPADGGSAIIGYRIDYLDGGGGIIWQELVADTGTADAEYTDDYQLSANEDRAYRVFAINALGTGPTSAVAYGNTNSAPATEAPGAVTSLSVRQGDGANAPTQLKLSWSAPADDGGSPITSYRIYMARTSDGVPAETVAVTVSPDFTAASPNPIVIDTDSAMTSYSLMDLRAQQTWYISVRAVNKSGAAGADAVSTADALQRVGTTGLAINPDPPTDLRAVATADDAVALYWYWPMADGGSDIADFRVEVKRAGKSWPAGSEAEAADEDALNTALSAADGDGNAAIAAALNTDGSAEHAHASIPADLDGDGTDDTNPTQRTLTYRVFTETAAGNRSGPSNEYTVTLDASGAIPFAEADGTAITPTATAPTPAVAGVLNLNWDAVANAGAGYRIDYAVGGTGNLQWRLAEPNMIFTDLPYKHGNLEAGDHRYRVFAQPLRRAVASSIFAGTAAASSAAAAPGAPTDLQGTVVNAGQIDLEWIAPEEDGGSEITGYRIVMATGAGVLPVADSTATATPDFTAVDATVTIDTDDDGTSYSLMGLSSLTTWQIAVYALNSEGTSAASAGPITLTTTEFGAPAPPIGLLVEEARNSNLAGRNQRGVLLLWNAPEPPDGAAITGYQIQWKEDMEGEDYSSLTITDANTLRTHHTHADDPEEDEVRLYRVRTVANSSFDNALEVNELMSDWVEVRYPASTLHNHAPMAVGTIAPVTVMAGMMTDAMDVSTYFSDTAGDMLTYTAMSDMEMIATASVDGSMLTIMGVAPGMATITVTATDMAGETAMQDIMVTVNAAPMAVGTIAPVTVTEGMMSDAMDVSTYFSDTAGDMLTYTAMSDMEMIATASVDGSMLTIMGVAPGMATITVTATDMAGETAMQSFMVTVESAITELTAPTDVMAMVDDSDPGNAMVTVTWMDGANADRHVVILFDSNWQTRAEWIAGNQTDMTTTFSNVPSGMYTAVVVAVENGPTGNAMNIEYGTAMATVN